ncbi:hypothetical protein BH11CYA1_BH11CYA1_13820 [soil metagenome]
MQKRASQVLVGDLLVQSELVSLSQLADAMPVALKTGVPVGRVLIASSFLSEENFRHALGLQSLVRDQLISEAAAISSLKLIAMEDLSLNDALKKLGIDSEYFNSANRLGELLISAGAIDATALETALSVSFTTGLQLARVLALRGFIHEQVAFVALIAQSLLRDHKLAREQAVDCIKTVMLGSDNGSKPTASEKSLISSALTARKIRPIRLGELLLLSGMVSQKALLNALDKGISEEVALGRMLIRMNLLTEVELNQALILQEMVTSGTVSPQDASQALAKVKATDVSLSRALLQTDQQNNSDAELSFEDFLVACGVIGPKPKDAAQAFAYFKSKRLTDEQCTLVLQLQKNGKKKEDLDEILKAFNW